MFQYGMIYFGTMLLLNITTDTLWLLSLFGSSISSLGDYVGCFVLTLPSILTSRFMLDIWETNAKIERGGAANTGSFSLDLAGTGGNGSTGRRGGTIGTLVFVNSYGGPASSYNDNECDDGEAQGVSEDMNANATATDEEARSDQLEAGVAPSGMASGSGSALESNIV
ncbi:hypothetical protein C8Q77DRAFT_1151292 [Trametes polyzona]|nr:hypothetical protein C8Q77DRAFT_1151292 [Trametes polyzona]